MRGPQRDRAIFRYSKPPFPLFPITLHSKLICEGEGNRNATGTLLTSFNRCRALHTTPAQLRASLKYPPVGGGLRRTVTSAPAAEKEASDDDDDLERELDEFDPEELFEDEDITNRPQQRDTAGTSADQALLSASLVGVCVVLTLQLFFARSWLR